MKRADFMRGRFGLMSHWLYNGVDERPGEDNPEARVREWNERVDAFDVKKLASQVAETGASWFILTIGQNTGFYCAPNPVYDEIAGYEYSKCSRRDLFFDLATELATYGIKTIAYLPSGAPAGDRQAVTNFEWRDLALRDETGTMLRGAGHFRVYEVNEEGRLANFQRKWERVIAYWAKAWGKLCAGWWIDGVYYANAMYNFEEEPNFHSFSAALRAGNQEAAITFNPGIQRLDHPLIQSEEEDYSAGELNTYLYAPFGRKRMPEDIADGRVSGAQLQLLDFLGTTWGQGQAPRYPAYLACAWTRYITENNGAVTWDIPTERGGAIPEGFMPTLMEIGKAVNQK